MNFAKCLRTPFFLQNTFGDCFCHWSPSFLLLSFFLIPSPRTTFSFLLSLCVTAGWPVFHQFYCLEYSTFVFFFYELNCLHYSLIWFSSVISSIVFTILFFSLLVVLWVSTASALITAAPLAMPWSGPSAFWDFSWCFLSVLPFLFGICDIFCLVPPVSITFVILIDFWYDLLHHFLHHHYRLLLFYSSNCESEACCGANFLVCGLFDFRLLGDPSWFVYGK